MFTKRGTSGQCFFRMEMQNGSISHCTVTSNPARLNPKSRPPIPEKNDATVGRIQSASQEFLKTLFNRLQISYFASPHDYPPPSKPTKQTRVGRITAFVPVQFYVPIASITVRSSTFLTAMSMPEASVHFDDRVMTRQDDIRVAREIFCMKTKSETIFVQKPPHRQFG